jgi:hypothetical protein
LNSNRGQDNEMPSFINMSMSGVSYGLTEVGQNYVEHEKNSPVKTKFL